MVTKQLSVDTIRHNSTLTLVLQVISTTELGEAPLSALNDLLAARELELGTTQSFTGMGSIAVLAPHRKEDLANVHPSAGTLGLAKGTPHSSLEPISPSTRKHLVDTKHMERVNPDPQVEGILSCRLGHVLVASDTCSLKSLTGYILLLPRDKVNTVGELINALLLHSDIIDPDLGVRYTTAVPGFGIWLVLDLAIAPCRPSAHGGGGGGRLRRLLRGEETKKGCG
jgi:hypothetical protein